MTVRRRKKSVQDDLTGQLFSDTPAFSGVPSAEVSSVGGSSVEGSSVGVSSTGGSASPEYDPVFESGKEPPWEADEPSHDGDPTAPPEVLPVTPGAMLALLQRWQADGWLRHVDVGLARFLAQESGVIGPLASRVGPTPGAGPAGDDVALTLLGAALCSWQLGRGHVCLDLQALAADAVQTLGIPVQGMLAAVDVSRWLHALQACPMMVTDAQMRAGTGECEAQAPAGSGEGTGESRRPASGGAGTGAGAGAGAGAASRSDMSCTTGAGTGAGEPLVLAHGRLYLRRLWQYEQDVQQGILQRLAGGPSVQAAAGACSHGSSLPDAPRGGAAGVMPGAATGAALTDADLVNAALADTALADGGLTDAGLADALAALFPDRAPTTDWQKVACLLASRQRFGLITGGPGTGKTTTVLRLLALLQWQALQARGSFLRIGLAAPTGKAAARLSGSIRGAIGRLPLEGVPRGEDIRAAIPHAVGTLHRLLGSRPGTRHFRHDARDPLRLDVLVVDEASMIDLEMMAHVMHALPPQARLILLGDKDQLASVEAGAILGELCARAKEGHYWPATAAQVRAVASESVDAALQDAQGLPLDQSICMLRHSHRFGADSGIGRLAAHVNDGNVRGVAQLWQAVEQSMRQPAEVAHAGGAGAAGAAGAASKAADIERIEVVDEARRALRQLVVHGRGWPVAADTARVSRQVQGSGSGRDRDDRDGELEKDLPVGYAHYLRVMRQGRPADDASQEAFDAWAGAVLQAHGRFQLLCALREGHWGVERLNQQIALWLQGAGLLSHSEGWYAGRPVLITHNDYELRLMNGDVGITLAGPGGRLRVVFPDEQGGVRWVLPSRLSSAQTVFAMTVHKAQGSEFDHAALAMPDTLSPVLTRELVYTAITRARRFFTLVGSGADAEAGTRGLDAVMAQAIRRQVQRASGLMTGALAGERG